MKAIISIIAILAVGCGAEGENQGPGGPGNPSTQTDGGRGAPIDLAMYGIWYGELTLSAEGHAPRSFGSLSDVSGTPVGIYNVRDNDAVVSLPCIMSPQVGRILAATATGTERILVVGPQAPCPEFGLRPGCLSRIIYSSADLTLGDDGHLRMNAIATYEDCDGTYPATISFDAPFRR